jgi:hypothetical protein
LKNADVVCTDENIGWLTPSRGPVYNYNALNHFLGDTGQIPNNTTYADTKLVITEMIDDSFNIADVRFGIAQVNVRVARPSVATV